MYILAIFICALMLGDLERDDMVFAIVSAYVYNFPWLYSMIKPEVPVIAVAQDPQGTLSIFKM